jgi:predicted Fe-S protein YdhL (DUF1289 family)
MKKETIFVRLKQSIKGIYDSPCQDQCNIRNHKRECEVCGLLRSEKKHWKYLTEIEKREVENSCRSRIQI